VLAQQIIDLKSDTWRVLGLNRLSYYHNDAVKKAYKDRALIVHPDKCDSVLATEAFKGSYALTPVLSSSYGAVKEERTSSWS
jgi:DnaJ-class molecular chaperone